MMQLVGRFLPVLTVAGLLSQVPLFAQADVSTAGLKGTVSDQSGAVVAGAKVKVGSVERGAAREAVTDNSGVYQFAFLQPGEYELRVEAPGLETRVVKGVQLTVGQVGVYDVPMQVGAVTTEVVISAEAPLVETEKTQQANTIQTAQIATLPNLSRNFFSYVYTLPGVASSNAPRAQGNGNFNFGSTGFSIGGSNGRANLITIDGGENEIGDGEPRFFVSPEAVQEFQVNRNGFAAEFGFTSGTAMNVITRSGTNTFHGSGYLFFRSQRTSARNFFDRQPGKAYDQKVYPGFTLGGPIVENRLFFFTSFESSKLDAARFRRYTDNAALLGPSADQSALLQRLNASGDPNLLRISATLNAMFNARNFPSTMKLLNSNEGTFNGYERKKMWMAKIDYQISSADSLSARFTLYRSQDGDRVGANNLVGPSNGGVLWSKDYTTIFNWTHNFRPNIINQARFQIAPKASSVLGSVDPNGTEIVLSGIGTFGRSYTMPFNTFQDRYQIEDTLSVVLGRHFVKFGGSYRAASYRVVNDLWYGGSWTFQGGTFPVLLPLPAADQTALATFNRGTAGLPTFTALQSFSLGLPLTYRQGFGNSEWRDWTRFLGLFVQDSWKVSPRFTLDYGVRFDHDAEPSPLGTYNHASPRLGFAWDPMGNQRTVIRGGGGIYHAPVGYHIGYLVNLLNDSGKYINQVFRVATTAIPVWAAGVRAGKLPFTGLNAGDLAAVGVSVTPKGPGRVIFDASKDYTNTYSAQVNLGITQSLGGDFALDVAYNMYRGVHIQLDHETNFRESGQVQAGIGPIYAAIDPTIAQFNNYSSIGNSTYHGLTTSLTKRYSANTQFQVNYTFSKSIDDVTDYNSAFAAFIPTNLRLERAISTFDVPHNFVASAILQSPFRSGPDRNFLSRALADISVSPIISVRSGIPFTLLLGGDYNRDNHPGDRPFYAARNTGRGDPFQSVDLRLTKQFYIDRDRGLRVEFVAEATNLFNHTNFEAVNNFVGLDPRFVTNTPAAGVFNVTGDRSLPSTSPLGFTSAFDPRRFQFGLRIAF